MRKRLPFAGAFLTFGILSLAAHAGPQDAKPFEDVKPDSWAYTAAANLHARGVIAGYADGHFGGQHTLTRYEFAVALKRALDSLPADGRSFKVTRGAKAGDPPPLVDRDAVDELQRLSIMFRDELVALGIDTKDMATKLTRLFALAADSTRRTERILPRTLGGGAVGRPIAPRSGSDAVGAVIPDSGPQLLGGAGSALSRDGFGLRAKIGGATTTIFGSAVGAGSSANPFLGGATVSPYSGSTLQLAAPGVLGAQQFYGQQRQPGSGMPAFLNFGGAPGRLFGVQSDVRLSRSGAIGLTYLDYSSDRTDRAGNGAGVLGGASSDLALYGASLTLNPSGRLALSGEAAKSVTGHKLTDDGSDIDDNNAYLLNLKYNGGGVTGTAGYQYYDPGFLAPGYVGNLGSSYNPANLQGPFARVGGTIDRLRADFGVDYLTAAKNRPGFGGFTQGSSVIRGQAGLGYHFSKQFELTASYEGVLYDMSGAISASGMRAKPVEQYITLGAGLNLSGSSVLRLAYQIINVQDPNNGFGIAGIGGGSANSASTAVVTTQFAVHF